MDRSFFSKYRHLHCHRNILYTYIFKYTRYYIIFNQCYVLFQPIQQECIVCTSTDTLCIYRTYSHRAAKTTLRYYRDTRAATASYRRTSMEISPYHVCICFDSSGGPHVHIYTPVLHQAKPHFPAYNQLIPYGLSV